MMYDLEDLRFVGRYLFDACSWQVCLFFATKSLFICLFFATKMGGFELTRAELALTLMPAVEKS